MGEPFRIPYGLALGRANAFNYRFGPTEAGTAGLLKEGSVAVDVTQGTLFYTNNSSAVTISALTNRTYSSNTGNQNGRVIRIVFLDTATQVSQAGNIVLAGTGNFGAIGIAPLVLDLMQVKDKWYEMSRNPQTTQDYSTVSLSGTVNTSVNANGVQTVLVTQTGAATQVSAISGGYIGQAINIIVLDSANATVTVTTGGGLYFENTAGVMVRATGGAFSFVKVAANSWYMLSGNSKKLN